jgi:subtilisin family serine protease
MRSTRISVLVLLCLCVAACARMDRPTENSLDSNSLERQVLVLLRLPAPHFRPDASYTGTYDRRAGSDARRKIAERLATRYGLKIIDGWPVAALGVDCFVMEAPVNVAPAQIVEKLSLDPAVESAQQMQLFRVLAQDPLYPLQPSARLWNLGELHKITTGKRVRVAEIDTGVEVNHPDLTGQVAAVRNFVDGRHDVAEWHGTAIAGIIAARADDGAGIAGIAPQAKILALRACWQASAAGDAAAFCSSFTLAKALQFALDENAQVINLSLGGPRDRLLERLLDTALSRGITVVGAADPKLGNGGFPASHRGVLAVAGDDGHDVAGDILVAPGRDIPTTMAGQKWGFVTGSSFAAAHVTGLVALLREIAPDLRPDQLLEALAPRALRGASDDRHVIVDACEAVRKAAGTCACACTVARDIGSRSSP